MGLLKILVKVVGILLIVIGIVAFALGLYGLSGGAGVNFYINEKLVTPQEFGNIITPVGLVILLIGIGLSYYGFKKME